MKKLNLKKILFIGLLAAVFLLTPFSFTHAQSVIASMAANSVISFISWTLGTILFVVGYFFHLVLYLGGVILNWVLELNANIVDNPAVQIGWPITRDIANLAFVFLIIIIAFETILRTGSLQIKQALPKLIVAALLINFSLLIATILLDFAGVFTNFFLGSAYSASGNGGISQALAGAMNMYSFLKTPTFDANVTLTTFGAGTVQFLSSLIFADIMTAVGAITMIGLAAMFLIRYVVIGILLITLPAAIIGWVAGGSGWGEWSKKFFKQAFFGPIAAFYIYIALKAQTAIQGIVSSSSITKAVADDPSHVIQGTATNIGSMIMVVAILMYGIKKAEEGSEYAGKWTTNAATGAMSGIWKGTAGAGLSIAARTFTRGKYSAEELSKKLSNVSKNSKSGLIRGLTRPLRQAGTAGKEFQENYGGLTGGIVAATTGGIATGLGFKPQEFKKKEEKEYEKRTETIGKMGKTLAEARGWNATMPVIATPADITANDAILQVARHDVEQNLNTQHDDEKETALDKTKKQITEQADTEVLARQFKISNAEVVKAIKANRGDKTEARKSLQLENVDIPIAMKQLGITDRTTIDKALKANAGSISRAKESLQKEFGEMREGNILNKQMDALTSQLASLNTSLKTPPAGKTAADIQREIEKVNDKLDKLKGNP